MSEDKTPRNTMTTYDIETEYQQQIAPFEKKLVRLKKSFETKSLRLHKGFLTKEKKAQTKLHKIDTDAKKAHAKIENSTSAKLAQLKKVDQQIKKSLKEKTKELEEAASEEKIVYQSEIDAIRDDLHKELEELHQDYLANVHVYQEKLDSYKAQSNEKQNLYKQTYDRHIKALTKEFSRVADYTSSLQKNLLKAKKAFLKDIEKSAKFTGKAYSDALSKADAESKSIEKKTQSYHAKIEAFIDGIKSSYVNHYQPMLTSIKEQEILLKDTFEKDMKRLDEDFAFRTKDEDTSMEQTSKTNEKNRKKRLDLFTQRYALYKELEETMKDRQLALLTYEQAELKTILNKELTNLDKLELFLKNDFDEIQAYSSQIHHLENDLYSKVDLVHQQLHKQLESSTTNMINFVDVFQKKVQAFEESLIGLIKKHLEELHPLNLEIDRLDREIDLSEPEKEIALNDFEEQLALQEIRNRYQIKILNKEHEMHLIDAKLTYDISVLSFEYDQKRLENDFEITSTKIKHETKMQVEDAKRKFLRAKEIYHLRENSLKHDEKQALLQIETDISKLEIKRDKAPIEAEKSQLLSRKEIATTMKQLEQKRDLESHMVAQKYKEQLKDIDHQIERLEAKKDMVHKKYKMKKDQIKQDHEKEVSVIKEAHDQQVSKLAEALERECKLPKENMQKWDAFQEGKHDQLRKVLVKYQEDTSETNAFLASIENIDQVLDQFDQETTITNTTNAIFGLYDVYLNTLQTLFSITKESLEDQVSLSIDTTAQRKLARDLEKRVKDFEKQIVTIKKARDQQVKSFVFSLNERLRKLSKQKFSSTAAFMETFTNIQEDNYDSLSHLQEELSKEIKALFGPIMEEDKQIIKRAEANQKQAKSKLEEDLQNNLRPLEVALKKDLSAIDDEEASEFTTFDQEIDELNEKKNYLQTNKEQEITRIDDNYKEELGPYEEHLFALDEHREQGEVRTLEAIDQELTQKKEQEQSTKTMYEEKLKEAKGILEFEEKIEQTTKETAKNKEETELSRKREIIDHELKNLSEKEKHAKVQWTEKQESLRQSLYDQTTVLGHESNLSNPEIQKEMQELRNQFEDKEQKNRELLLSTKKKVRHNIESFDQQVRVEYNEFFENLNQHIERMKTSYHKEIKENNQEFQDLHVGVFSVLEESYVSSLKAMKSTTVKLTQQLQRLNKNL